MSRACMSVSVPVSVPAYALISRLGRSESSHLRVWRSCRDRGLYRSSSGSGVKLSTAKLLNSVPAAPKSPFSAHTSPYWLSAGSSISCLARLWADCSAGKCTPQSDCNARGTACILRQTVSSAASCHSSASCHSEAHATYARLLSACLHAHVAHCWNAHDE